MPSMIRLVEIGHPAASSVRGATESLSLPALAHGGRGDPADALLYTRDTVFDDGQALPTPRYARDRLLAEDTSSPARRSSRSTIQHDPRPARLCRPRALARRHARSRATLSRRGRTCPTTVDPISLQVIGGALHAIAEQMGTVLYRMSYSSIIRESQDLGAGLFDRDFNTLAESDSTPMHIGSLPGYLRGIEKSMPLDAWKPGDLRDPQPSRISAPAIRPTSPSSCRCSTKARWSDFPPTRRITSTSAPRRPA